MLIVWLLPRDIRYYVQRDSAFMAEIHAVAVLLRVPLGEQFQDRFDLQPALRHLNLVAALVERDCQRLFC